MYCFKCGRQIEDTARFCIYCGVRVSDAEDDSKDKNKKLAALARRMQEGDTEAFNDFYAETQKYVRYVAKQCGTDDSNVEDVVQEVYISIYQKIHSLKDPDAVWGWLKMITRNTAIDAYRKNEKYVLASDEDSEYVFDNIEVTDTLALPEDAMDNKDTQQLIASILDELPKMQRLVMIDFYFNERKVRQISADLGIAEGTIKSYLAKARRAVENKLIVYQKTTGVKLCTMPLAPVLYLAIREGIANTAATSAVPSAITAALAGIGAQSTAAAGAASGLGGAAVQGAADSAVKTAAGETAKAAAGEAAKTATGMAAKAAAGVTAAAVLGTGTAAYVFTHSDVRADRRAITAVTEEFEDACRALDNDAILACLSEESSAVLERYDLTAEYVLSDTSIYDETDFSMEIEDIQVDGDQASAWCTYVQPDAAGGAEWDGYLGYIRENGEWKINLCRESKRIYRDGSFTTDARFPQLVETELIYNDEIEK